VKHLDLFSGIGGFSLACDWLDIETICFCEIDKFCQKVLKKHWPDVEIVEDVNNVEEIKQIVANAERGRIQARAEQSSQASNIRGLDTIRRDNDNGLLLTAGFPCQPFSQAGRRKGSADDRYFWPQTLAVIEAVKPDWVLLENVAGLLSMVFPDSAVGVASQASLFGVKADEIADYDTIAGRIDGDLRQAGYETVWLVIPACAVNAPHRRDRVWIVAKSQVNRGGCQQDKQGYSRVQQNSERWSGVGKQLGDTNPNATITQSRQPWQPPKPEGREDTSRGDSEGGDARYSQSNPSDSFTKVWQRENPIARGSDSTTANSSNEGLEGSKREQSLRLSGQPDRSGCYKKPDWAENWYEVATKFCRVDARISDRVDRLKALGNAIVPQVAYQIIKAIVETESMLVSRSKDSV